MAGADRGWIRFDSCAREESKISLDGWWKEVTARKRVARLLEKKKKKRGR
jgi:hypothetical protein